MNQPIPNLTALLGSRICHDLISPLGAISNGVELIEMSGAGLTPEMELVAESASSANVRIRFFRIAYGSADTAQLVSRNELKSILKGLNDLSRTKFRWFPVEDEPRVDVKVAFLLMQCLDTVLPLGGEVLISREGKNLKFEAETAVTRINDELWSMLENGPGPIDITPDTVQFALLPIELHRQGRLVVSELTHDKFTVEVRDD